MSPQVQHHGKVVIVEDGYAVPALVGADVTRTIGSLTLEQAGDRLYLDAHIPPEYGELMVLGPGSRLIGWGWLDSDETVEVETHSSGWQCTVPRRLWDQLMAAAARRGVDVARYAPGGPRHAE